MPSAQSKVRPAADPKRTAQRKPFRKKGAAHGRDVQRLEARRSFTPFQKGLCGAPNGAGMRGAKSIFATETNPTKTSYLMAKNALPPNLGDLIKLGSKMAGGLTALGQSLNITQLSAATLQGQLTAFATAQTIFNTTRDARQAASTLCTDSHAAIYEWLLKGRDVLLPYLGRSWSAAWIPAGLVNHSTAVPAYVGDQLNLLGLISAFFTANPNYEDAAIGVTGTAGTTMKTTSEAADTALNAAKTLAATKKDARDAALEALKGSMRMLIRILDELLEADDPRWASFGLNMPDAETTPAAPKNLVANFADGPVLLASCEAVPLATRYRWRIKVVGLETEFRLAASTKSPLAQIDKVLPGQSVELMVQAANQTSQSVPSESVFVTLPVLSAATPKAAAPVSGEAGTGYTSLPANSDSPAKAKGNSSSRGSRKLESNGARH